MQIYQLMADSASRTSELESTNEAPSLFLQLLPGLPSKFEQNRSPSIGAVTAADTTFIRQIFSNPIVRAILPAGRSTTTFFKRVNQFR